MHRYPGLFLFGVCSNPAVKVYYTPGVRECRSEGGGRPPGVHLVSIVSRYQKVLIFMRVAETKIADFFLDEVRKVLLFDNYGTN